MKKIFTIVVLMFVSALCINAQNEIDDTYFCATKSANIKNKKNKEVYELCKTFLNEFDELINRHIMMLKQYVDTVKLYKKGEVTKIDGKVVYFKNYGGFIGNYEYNNIKQDNFREFERKLSNEFFSFLKDFFNKYKDYRFKKIDWELKNFFILGDIELHNKYLKEVSSYGFELFGEKLHIYEHTKEELEEERKLNEGRMRKEEILEYLSKLKYVGIRKN